MSKKRIPSNNKASNQEASNRKAPDLSVSSSAASNHRTSGQQVSGKANSNKESLSASITTGLVEANSTNPAVTHSYEALISHLNKDELELLQVAAAHAYFAWMPEDGSVYISDSLLNILGYGRDDLSFATITDVQQLIHLEDWAQMTEEMLHAIETGRSYEYEMRMRQADNSYRWMKVRGRSFKKDPSQKVSKLLGCLSDIHDLKQLQFQAESGQQRSDWLRRVSTALFEAGGLEPVADALKDLGEMLHCNRVYLRLRDLNTGSFMVVSEWYAANLQAISKVLPYEYERVMQTNMASVLPDHGILIRTPDDVLSDSEQYTRTLLSVNHAALLPLYQQGELLGVLALMSENEPYWSDDNFKMADEFAKLVSLVHERQMFATTLQESQERFRLAMEATQDGLWDMNIQEEVVHVSPSYFHMLGYNRKERVASLEECVNFVVASDRDMVNQALHEFLKSPEESYVLEYRMRHRNGSDVWVMTRVRKVGHTASGDVQRIIGVNTNITAFKSTQERLEKAERESSAANQAKSEFLARMSHEIRTPMNAILGMSHLVLETNLDKEQLNSIKHIDEAARLLLHIIDDILDFSKIEAGKLTLEETDIDLLDMLSRLTNLFILKAAEKGIDLVLDIAVDVPQKIRSDVTRLNQILVNLLNNAVKFTEQGGVCLTVTLTPDHQFQFTVTDSGIGIDKRACEQLFLPFSQADGSVTRRYGGTGLGLAICKSLAEMMGGSITLDSALGKGSEFSLTLPLKYHEGANPSARSEIADSWVAMVDRYQASATAARHLFERIESEVFTFGSTQELLNTWQNVQLDSGRRVTLLLDDRSVSECQLFEVQEVIAHTHPDVMCLYVCDVHRMNNATEHLPPLSQRLSRPLTPEKLYSPLSVSYKEQSIGLPRTDYTSAFQGLHILLVEDNMVNQKVAVGMLKKYGLVIDVAFDGQQALDVLAGKPVGYYNLIFMDMEMPNLDGYEASRRIRQQAAYYSLPIIAMTAHAMTGDRERCLEAGMNDYLPKPINPELLFNMLSRYLSDTYSKPSQSL